MQLFHGDCLIEMDKIPDHSVDLILCDLPYGTTQCRWDVVIPFEPLWQQYWRVVKLNGAVVLFTTNPFTAKLICSQLEFFKYELIWQKTMATNFLNAKKTPLKKHENICVFYKKQPTYNPIMKKGTPYVDKRTNVRSRNSSDVNTNVFGEGLKKIFTINEGFRYPDSIIEESNSNANRLHPTQKPVALLEFLIKSYTNESEIVLDNCMGSGSTGVACINTNRNFIGIEKDDRYFEIAKNRLGLSA